MLVVNVTSLLLFCVTFFPLFVSRDIIVTEKVNFESLYLCVKGCPTMNAMMTQREILTLFPGVTASLKVTVTMINGQSTRTAGRHPGNGFYPHLKVNWYFFVFVITPVKFNKGSFYLLFARHFSSQMFISWFRQIDLTSVNYAELTSLYHSFWMSTVIAWYTTVCKLLLLNS